jgi:hypothetical protein
MAWKEVLATLFVRGKEETELLVQRGGVIDESAVATGAVSEKMVVDEHAKLKIQQKTKQSSQPRARESQVTWIPGESHVRGIPRASSSDRYGSTDTRE